MDSDQLDKGIGCILAMFLGGAFLLFFVLAAGLFLLETESGESTPQQARRWFENVDYSDASSFTNVQHYTDQGIDFSHHFRFGFSDLDELQPIIKYHGLTRANTRSPIRMDQLPNWYEPFNVPADALRFGCGGREPMVLIVDLDAKIAYFEMVHL